MESDYLKTLLEVVKTGSFSAAADNLFVTQSAVSRRIRFLEERYGHPLLERTASGIRPTDAGKVLLKNAVKILALERKLDKDLAEINTRPEIRFGCSRPFEMRYLPEILRIYTERYDQLDNLKLVFDKPLASLDGIREHRLDMALIEHWEELELSAFRTLPLPGDEMVFVSAPGLGLPPQVTADDIMPYRLYRRHADCCSMKLLCFNMQAIGRDCGEFTRTATYDDLHVIMQNILRGEGIAFMTRSLVQHHLAEGTLREHRIAGFRHERNRTLILGETFRLTAPTRYFIDCICRTFGVAATEGDFT